MVAVRCAWLGLVLRANDALPPTGPGSVSRNPWSANLTQRLRCLADWLREQPLSGPGAETSSFFLARWLFLRLLGGVYLAAFLSLWVQIHGLIGSRGILPIGDYLADVRAVTGPKRYLLVPTLCWLDPSDRFLDVLCGSGVALSGLLILGIAPSVVLFLLWALYLSLTVAGQEFLGYQWDGLLLETGLLAVFLAPPQLWPRLARQAPPSGLVLWLFRWLLFRVMFGSGMAKLVSGDPTWRGLTALQYHYETQPLPTWTSWYVHQLPGWFHGLSVLLTFAAELLVPLGIFGPRRLRHAACAGIVALMLLIAATGNYGFFNLLTIVLCVPLLDDGVFPARWRARLASAEPRGRGWPRWLVMPFATGIFALSLLPFLAGIGLLQHGPTWLMTTYRIVESFRSVNRYGLFAVMTTRRPEILVEGSNDGVTWLPYDFRWKPGDVRRPPAFAGPHMPRLDWQMWFAALEDYRENPWFLRFLDRLLKGSPEVLALLERNPFPDQPPRYLRAVVHDYHFSDAAARAETGAWWRRERRGLYCPVLTDSGEAGPRSDD
jgi:hypothetical protein